MSNFWYNWQKDQWAAGNIKFPTYTTRNGESYIDYTYSNLSEEWFINGRLIESGELFLLKKLIKNKIKDNLNIKRYGRGNRSRRRSGKHFKI